jgi:hypothetical protein
MRVQILGEAEHDLVEGYRFYESQVAGLGDYFLDSLFSDIDSLQFHACERTGKTAEGLLRSSGAGAGR